MSNNPIVFREYTFQPEFPFIYMKSTSTAPQTAFMHFHDCIELAVLEKGYMIWNIENQCTRISPGTICIVPPHFTHTSWFPPDQSDDVLCHYLFFKLDDLLLPYCSINVFQDMLLDCYYAFPHTLQLDQHSSVLLMLHRIIQIIQEKSPSYQQEIRALLHYLLIKYWRSFRHLTVLQSGYDLHDQSSYPVTPALTYIEKNYQQEIPFSQLAQLCNMPEPQFIKTFQKTTGKSILQHIRQVRIQKACSLLVSTEDSILEIAYAVGFASLASFNRAFSQVMGKSPSAFRNEQRSIRKQEIQHLPYPHKTL